MKNKKTTPALDPSTPDAATSAASLQPEVNIQPIPLKLLHPSRFQSREAFPHDQLQELAESIRENGLVQFPVVRPHPETEGHYELVCGERRMRAHELLGRDFMRCSVREMDDREALGIITVENLQRENLNPLEEARGWQRLQDAGLSMEEMIKATGISKGHIYARLKLLDLSATAQKHLLDGTLNASTAIAIVRIPDPEARKVAEKHILEHELSHRDALEYIHTEHMVRLKDTPFDEEAADLVPVAADGSGGPCSACPFRTGVMHKAGTLTKEECKAPDICTKPSCWSAKKDATTKQTVEKAAEKGVKLIPHDEAAKLFSYRDSVTSNAPYVKLDERVWLDGGWVDYKKVLGKNPEGLAIAISPESGNAVQLVPKATLIAALKAKKISLPYDLEKKAQTDDPKERQRRAKELRDQRVEKRAEQLTYAALANEAEKASAPGSSGFWKLLLAAAIDRAEYDVLKDTCQRRGIEPVETKHPSGSHKDWRKGLDQHCETLLKDAGAMRGLAMELLLHQRLMGCNPDAFGKQTLLTAACEHFGVNVKTMTAEARVEVDKPKAEGRGAEVKPSGEEQLEKLGLLSKETPMQKAARQGISAGKLTKGLKPKKSIKEKLAKAKARLGKSTKSTK